MNQQKKRIIGLAAALILLATLPAAASMKKVYFLHKTNKTLKLDCIKFKGRNDAFPTYRCYEDNGTSHTLKPGTDWELVEVENVCFQHQGRDTIKSCLKITGQGQPGAEFACFAENEMFRFQPTAKWLEIDGKDQRCAPHQPTLEEVPRTVVFPELPVEQAEDGLQK